MSNKWWENEVISLSGGWHPLAARIRAGGVFDNEEELYDWEHSEERVLKVKSLGINLIVSQYDRGLGDADQYESQEKAKKLAALCHKHGLRHGSYIANTVYFESMLKEYPDCENMVVKTYDNRFIHYGSEQTWRWVACFNSPHWRKHVKKQIKKAIEYVETDLLHFDNLALWPEPDSCHCEYCQAAFRTFLQEKYPGKKEQIYRFGFTGFATFRAPNFYLRFTEPWDLDRFNNPLMQEWILFRCHKVTSYIKNMVEYARDLKVDIAIDSNAQSVWGVNQALISGINSTAQAKFVDIVWEENPDYREDKDADAVAYSLRKIRGMNLMRRLGKKVFTVYKNSESLAFNLTFCGTPGINQNWGYAEPRKDILTDKPDPEILSLLQHSCRHNLFYVEAKVLAKIGIWRNQRSLAWVNFTTHLSACVMEQTLFKRRIPFSIIQDEFINEKELKEFDLIILPNVEYIAESEIKIITAFIKEGGAVLITEQSGVYTDLSRKRSVPAFAHLFNCDDLSLASINRVETADFEPNRQFDSEISAGVAARNCFGKGRVAYIPKLDYVYGPRAFKSNYNVHYDGTDSRYWKEPRNVEEILEAIKWLKEDYLPIKIVNHPELSLDWLRFKDNSQGCTLFRCGDIDDEVEIIFAVRSAAMPEEGVLYIPEEEKGIPLSWTKDGDYWQTSLPAVKRHALIKYCIGD